MSSDNDILSLSVRQFAANTAAKTPTPGGGSVAGVVGALAVALGEMTLNFTKGKKKFVEHADYHDKLSARLARAHGMFLDLVADDISAYQLYQEASRKEDGPEKADAVQVALAAAIAVPREMTKLSLAVLDDMLELAGKCNTWLITDLLASATLSAATARLSDYNVRINAPNIDNEQARADFRQASTDDLAKANQLLEQIETAAKQYLP